jgi:hypothetical protein
MKNSVKKLRSGVFVQADLTVDPPRRDCQTRAEVHETASRNASVSPSDNRAKHLFEARNVDAKDPAGVLGPAVPHGTAAAPRSSAGKRFAGAEEGISRRALRGWSQPVKVLNHVGGVDDIGRLCRQRDPYGFVRSRADEEGWYSHHRISLRLPPAGTPSERLASTLASAGRGTMVEFLISIFLSVAHRPASTRGDQVDPPVDNNLRRSDLRGWAITSL